MTAQCVEQVKLAKLEKEFFSVIILFSWIRDVLSYLFNQAWLNLVKLNQLLCVSNHHWSKGDSCLVGMYL